MKHERYSRLTKKFIASAMLAVALLSSGNSYAESPLIEDEQSLLTNRIDECQTEADSINVGFKLCKEDVTIKLLDKMLTDSVLSYPVLEAFGWVSTSTKNEMNAGDYFNYYIEAIQIGAGIILGVLAFVMAFRLQADMRASEKKWKEVFREEKARFLLKLIYVWLFIIFLKPIVTLLIAFVVMLSSAILGLYFYMSTTKSSEEIQLGESESKTAAREFASNLMAASRAVADTKTALFDQRLVKYSDMPLSEAIAKFNQASEVQWVKSSVSRNNFDMTTDFSNMFNKYEFVSEINLVYVKNTDKDLYGNKLSTPIATYVADNSVFKDIEGNLEGDGINDGTILSALSEASATASNFGISAVLNEYTMAIKADLKSNAYSDSNAYESVSQKIYASAESAGAAVSAAIQENVENAVDRVALTSSAYKKLSDSALGNNTAMTISEYMLFSDKIAKMEKIAQCSKDYKMYNSARANIGKLNYSASVQANIQNNAFSWNSCITIGTDRIEVIGFDGEAQPEKLLEVEQTIEAGRLALERTVQTVRTAYQHASDKSLNVDSENGNSQIQKSQTQLLIKALKQGLVGAGIHMKDVENAAVERFKARTAFTSANVLMFNGGASESTPYIISERIFPKSSSNDYTEAQKNLFEKYTNLYTSYSYTKFNRADFSDLASVDSAAVTEQNDLMAWIESQAFDFKPLQLMMGLSTSESFVVGMKKCQALDNCKGKDIPLTTFLSMMGESIAKAAVTIIVAAEVTDTLKGFMNNLGDSVQAGASNSKLASLASGALKLIGSTSKAVLGIVSAALDVMKPIAYTALPIAFLLAFFLPMFFAFIALFICLRFVSYVLFTFLTLPIELLFSFGKEDFRPLKHFQRLAANMLRMPIQTLFFVILALGQQIIPFGTLGIMLFSSLGTSLLNLVVAALLITVLGGLLLKWLHTTFGESSNRVVAFLGGDENEFTMTHFEMTVITAKLTEATHGVKNAVSKNTAKLKGKVKGYFGKGETSKPEPIKFKDVPQEPKS